MEVTIKVLGLDPQLLGTFAVASACMTYPQGLATEAGAGLTTACGSSPVRTRSG